MAKPIVLANGNYSICMDYRGRISDIYYPYIGLENHINSKHVNKIGVWVDGDLRWFEDGSWDFDIGYKKGRMVSDIEAINSDLGIKIKFHDVVYNEKDVLVRHLKLFNLDDYKKEVKLYFDHQLEVYNTPHSDTGYYDPMKESIIHYLGKRAFLMHLKTEGKDCGFDDYSVGLYDIEGQEGTYKDAGDGNLEQNPIEHGRVSECIGSYFKLEGGSNREVFYWLAAAESIEEVQKLNDYVEEKGPEHLQKTASDYWKAWTNKQNFSFYGLNQEQINLFRTSQLLMRTHIDNDGAVIASLDSDMLWHGRDTYGYMWPRDGAYIALALDKIGDQQLSKTFFEFCSDIIRDEGFFMHKYRPDKSVGSSWHPWVHEGETILPIQEDETALVLVALWEHYTVSKDIEFIENIYNFFIENAADFLVDYRHEDSNLPKPSYDLWEEKFGTSTYTASTVYGGLMAAGKFANLLGKSEQAETYKQAAKEVQQATMEHLYDEQEEYFYKLVNKEDGEFKADKTIDISSVYGVFLFGLLNLDDDRLREAFDNMIEELFVDTEIGGVRRYTGDDYYNSYENMDGNPWTFTTLWYAQYKIATAEQEEDLQEVKNIFQWITDHALTSGVLSEQLDPYSGRAESATPLTWAHAEYIRTVVRYLEKLEEFGVCKACYPLD
ncbi:MAG: glycoside hydrolase family 15 protein [Candidatus Magasanikbacteria bacterium]